MPSNRSAGNATEDGRPTKSLKALRKAMESANLEPVPTPPTLTASQARYFESFVQVRLSSAWSAGDLIQLERLCKMLALADSYFDMVDPTDPEDPYFARASAISRACNPISRMLNLHPRPLFSTLDLLENMKEVEEVKQKEVGPDGTEDQVG